MPERLKTFCAHPGCRNIVPTGRKYCEELHDDLEQDRVRRAEAREDHRLPAAKRGYDYRWRVYAKRFLQRPENQFCVLHLDDDCAIVAQCVDHIDPPDGPDDPRFWDRANHQPACIHCNSVKNHRKLRGSYVFGEIRAMITMIFGYPGAGKSTLADSMAASKGGVVVDLDRIADAIRGGDRLGESKRLEVRYSVNAVMWTLAKEISRRGIDVYMPRTAPTASEWLENGSGVQVVYADASPQTAYARIKDRKRMQMSEAEYAQIVRRVDEFRAKLGARIETIRTE